MRIKKSRHQSRKMIITIALVGVLTIFSVIGFFLYSVPHLQLENKPPSPTLSPTIIPTLTPTIAPSKIEATYTFYIQTTSHKTSNGELTLNTIDTGKTLTVDIGTLIIVNFGRVGKFYISASSPQAIFTNFSRQETIHLPNNALGAFRIYRSGFGTITIIEVE